MSITQGELFRIALGLEKPWYIKAIEFKVEETQLDLHIDFESGSKFPCPLCGKSNPPELAECQYCQAPLKTGGFLAEPEGEGEQAAPPSGDIEKPTEKAPAPGPKSSLEAAIPDWLKQNEASFFGPPQRVWLCLI